MTKKISSIGNILMGLLLMIGPWYIFGVCSTEEKIMKWFWSCRAEFAIGALAVLLGILVLFTRNKRIVNETIMSIALSAMAILIPLVIIGGCMKPTMHCRTTTYPVFYVIGIVNILLQLFVLSKELRSTRRR